MPKRIDARRRGQRRGADGLSETVHQTDGDGLPPLPAFCRKLYFDDDGERLWVDFWAVEPVGDFKADHYLGLQYADDALDYAREREQPQFIDLVILAMAGVFDGTPRHLGAVEHAFLSKVQEVYPTVLDKLCMRFFAHNPKALH